MNFCEPFIHVSLYNGRKKPADSHTLRTVAKKKKNFARARTYTHTLEMIIAPLGMAHAPARPPSRESEPGWEGDRRRRRRLARERVSQSGRSARSVNYAPPAHTRTLLNTHVTPREYRECVCVPISPLSIVVTPLRSPVSKGGERVPKSATRLYSA